MDTIINLSIAVLTMVIITLGILFLSDEGIKEIHDKVAVVIEKPQAVETTEIEVEKLDNSYILKPESSI